MNKALSDYMSMIGRRGGKAGSRADKVRAINMRWERYRAAKKADIQPASIQPVARKVKKSKNKSLQAG